MSDDGDQSPLEKPPRKRLNPISSLTTFRRTRKAVRAGEPLFDWTLAQLRDKGFAEPWTLTVQTSLVASLPAVLLVMAVAPNQFLIAFLVPTHLTVLAFLAGWGSLKEKDSARESRARARRAYLYLNSTYGLPYQRALALAFPVFWGISSWVGVLEQAGLLLLLIFLVPLVYGGGNQYRLTFMEIPDHLFQINGYSTRVRHFWQKKRPDDPPWAKYNLAVLIGGLVCFYLILRILIALSWFIVEFLTTITMLVIG